MNQTINMIIPIYDTIILPDVDYQLGVGELTEEEKSRIKIDGNKTILLPMKAEKNPAELTLDDFYGLGVLADIIEIQEGNGGTRLHVSTREKVLVTDLQATGELLEGTWVPREEIVDITREGEEELLENLKKTALEISTHIQGGALAQGYIKNCGSITEFATMFCQFFGMTADEKYELLKTDSLKSDEKGSGPEARGAVLDGKDSSKTEKAKVPANVLNLQNAQLQSYQYLHSVEQQQEPHFEDNSPPIHA